ncbi:MAG TPA: hypothetical protein VH328_06400 [Burkholderiaceae bacterium]|jgi:hypothetical protein|nr:hypothetical protein [Burkholderiaceae bacterium]
MHFLPEDPQAYEAARKAIMARRGVGIRTLFALEAILAELDVDAMRASEADFQRALACACSRGTFATASAAALMMPSFLDAARALTVEGMAALRSLGRA